MLRFTACTCDMLVHRIAGCPSHALSIPKMLHACSPKIMREMEAVGCGQYTYSVKHRKCKMSEEANELGFRESEVSFACGEYSVKPNAEALAGTSLQV